MLRALLDHPDVTEVCELEGPFGLMAFHGGNLERTTDVIAREVAERTGASLYAVIQRPPLRHHIPSTAFDPDHSPALAGFVDHVDHVIAVHGYGRHDRFHHVLVGGRNRDLAAHVAGHLRAGVDDELEVVDDLEAMPRGLRGQHPDNPVNIPRGGGVQLELPPAARWHREEWGWSDHEGIGRAPQVDQVVDALVAAVASWPAGRGAVDRDAADNA